MAASIRPKTPAESKWSQADDSLPVVDPAIDTLLNGLELPPPPVESPPDLEALARELFATSALSLPDELPDIAGYEVLSVLGRGGMGVVYLAKQRGLNRLVAMKMLQARLVADPLHASRFRTEVEAIARLQHPNIVQVFEVREHNGRPFCALEYVAGGTLSEACRDHLPSPQSAAHFVAKLAEAVQYAHDRGVLHRDLKPANILLQIADCPSAIADLQSTIPKIADFGLAKWLDDTKSTGATEHGLIIGTPSYMAPEQVAGGSADIGVTTDVYALGAILYELLTGRPPFKADCPLETARQTQFEEPAPPRRLQPGLPRDLETICLHCLQKHPNHRYASAQSLADDLRRFCANEPILARRVGALERLWKWTRRRPAVAALLAVSAVALTSLGVAGWILAVREHEHARIVADERDAANQARREKEDYLRRTLASNERLRNLTDTFYGTTPTANIPKWLLNEIADIYRQDIERDKANLEPHMQRNCGKAMSRLSATLAKLGKNEEALDWKRQSVAIYRRLVADHPTELEFQSDLALAVNQLGQNIRRYGPKTDDSQAEALSLHREAVSIQQSFPPGFERRNNCSDLAAALNYLAAALLEQRNPNDLREVQSLFEQAIELQLDADRENSTRLSREFLIMHYTGLAETFVRLENYSSAVENLRKVKFDPRDSADANIPSLKREAAQVWQRCARLVEADLKLSPEDRQRQSKSCRDEAQKLLPATSRDNKKNR